MDEIAKRIKEVRLVKGIKQTAIAIDMKTTQQAYACLEKNASNAKLGTLKRYCAATNIDILFLLSDIPITKLTLDQFSNVHVSEIIKAHKLQST